MSVDPPSFTDQQAAAANEGRGLGAYLRAQRESKGLTLDQVSAATKINLKVLQHLEADDYPSLPAKPFIRGFVTSYARFIGLDPREVLLQFDRFLDSAAQLRPKKDGGHSGYAFEKREGADSSRVVLSAVMGGTLLIGVVALIFLKPHLRGHKASQVERLKQLHEARIPSGPMPEAGPSGNPSGTAVAAGPVVFGPQLAPTPAESEAAAATPKVAPSMAVTAAPSMTSGILVVVPPGYITPKVPLILAPPKPEKAPEKITEKLAAKPSEKPSEKPTEKAPEKTTVEKVAPTPSGAPAGQEKVAEKSADQPPEKTPAALPSESTPLAAASPAPVSSGGSSETGRPDPLSSGAGLKPEAIHYKVVVKAVGGDVWVRYRLDDRKVMKFILRADRVLVLRAEKAVRFQTSHWENLTYRLNGAGSRPFSDAKDLVNLASGKSYVFPTELRGNEGDFVTDNTQLPKWVPDSPRAASSPDVDSP